MMLTRRIWAHGGWELRASLRNGEQLLISFLLPLFALVVLTKTTVFPLDDPRYALAGVLAMCVLSSSFTAQAISLAMDRRYGVLRMFSTTALGPGGLLGGKALAVSGVVLLQTLVIAAVAWSLGVSGIPAVAWALVPLVLLLGVVGNVALAVIVGGTLRAEAVIAVANLLWILMLAAGALTPPSLALLSFLPPGALGNGLRAAIAGSFDPVSLAVLLLWAGALSVVARRTMRWD